MTVSDYFLGKIRPDGAVQHGKQVLRLETKRRMVAGEWWVFLRMGDGIRPMDRIDVALPSEEHLELLLGQLISNPAESQGAVRAWAATNAGSRDLLRHLVRLCLVPAQDLLGRLSEQLRSDRAEAGKAFVTWCQGDPNAAGIVRTALEATQLRVDPDWPKELVRWAEPDVLELPPRFVNGVDARVSPNGCRLVLRPLDWSTAPIPDGRLPVPLLSKFATWTGPRDVLVVREPGPHGAYAGTLAAHPGPRPRPDADDEPPGVLE